MANAQVMTDVKEVADIFPLLEKERTIFRQILYKNKNQHRRAPYFQYMIEIQRRLNRCDWKKIENVFLQVKSIVERLNQHPVTWKFLGTEVKAEVDFVLRELIACTRTFTEILQTIEKAYRSLSSQFAMSFFMPLALATNSMLARFNTSLRFLLVRGVEMYQYVQVLYLQQITLVNPLRAPTISKQLNAYTLAPNVLKLLSADELATVTTE